MPISRTRASIPRRWRRRARTRALPLSPYVPRSSGKTSAMSTTESTIARELPGDGEEVRIRSRDHDRIVASGARGEQRRAHVLRVGDAGVVEPYREIGRALAGRDHGAAR